MINEEQYNTHDCKLGPEDSCSTCEQWFEQREKEPLSEKVSSWARKLEDVLERNKVTGRDIYDIAESDSDFARGN